jgi:hypothetical protein
MCALSGPYNRRITLSLGVALVRRLLPLLLLSEEEAAAKQVRITATANTDDNDNRVMMRIDIDIDASFYENCVTNDKLRFGLDSSISSSLAYIQYKKTTTTKDGSNRSIFHYSSQF